MATERVFGPIRGAGTQITEVVGQKNLIQGRLGTTVFIGVFERGDEDDINMLPGPNSLLRRMGGLLDDADFNVPNFASLDAPQCAQDFWEHSEGAGSLICLRVVPKTNDAVNDDRPTKAQLPVFTRGLAPARIGYIEAKSGGYWAGKRNTFLGKISGTPGVDFPASNQIKLDGLANKSMKRDEWVGAVVVLDGIVTRTYKVIQNLSNGTLTLEADSDVLADWGAGETYGFERSGIGPFNLGTVGTADLNIDSDLGGPTNVPMVYASAGIVPGAAPTLPIAGGATVEIVINGTTYVAAVGGAANVQDLIDALNAVPGISSVENPAGQITTATDQKGTGATFALGTLTGVAATAIWGAGYTLTATGTGDVVNHLAATAAEISVKINSTAGGICTAEAQSDGSFILRTDTAGSLGWVRTPSGGMRSLLGLDTTQHYGTDGPSDLDVTLYKDNVITRGAVKSSSIIFKDGGLRPTTEFGFEYRVDGIVFLNYKNLSMVQGQSNYWVDVINNDPNNNHIFVVDQFGGDRSNPDSRPGNQTGSSSGLTATRLTIADPHISNLTVVGDWVPTITWNAWGVDAKPQRLKVLMTGPAAFTISTDHGNRTWDGTLGAALDMEDYVGSVTVNAGSGTPQAGDWFYLYLRPLVSNEAIGGIVVPKLGNAARFEVIGNGVDYVDISESQDLTSAGAIAGDSYRIEYKEQMWGGYDGYIVGMVSSDYEQLLDPSTTPLRKLQEQNLGLVKCGIPGITRYDDAEDLQKKLKTLVKNYNWNERIELPFKYHDWDIYTEQSLIDWADSFGRDDGDYTSTIFPCYGYVRDPLAKSGSDAGIVLVPTMGMDLGREALCARQYKGYHKAPAGMKMTLPKIVQMPAVGKPDQPLPLDQELLNPSGINIHRWKRKALVIWGDKTLSNENEYEWYHKRCLMSQYELDLQEGFDFTIFEINDPIEDENVLTDIHDYFLPEWRKRAIRGKTFTGGDSPAAIFKMDAENNTDATRGQGNQNLEISLRLPDTIERLRIRVSAMGVTEII